MSVDEEKPVYSWQEVHTAIIEGKFGRCMMEMFESPEQRKERLKKLQIEIHRKIEDGELPPVNYFLPRPIK